MPSNAAFLVGREHQSSGAVHQCRGGRPGLPVRISPYGLCGCKATLNFELGYAIRGECVLIWKRALA